MNLKKTNPTEFEYQIAENIAGLIEMMQAGKFDSHAERRGVKSIDLASAAICEMCRQAFNGEWR